MQSALCLAIDKRGFLRCIILNNVSAEVEQNVLGGGTHHRGCRGLIANLLVVVKARWLCQNGLLSNETLLRSPRRIEGRL